jgi:isopenicillin N synthase-like dioxygenase
MSPLLPAPAARPPATMVGGRLPVLDAGPFLRGEAGALEALAAELRFALENVGFYLLAGHGIDDGLIQRTYAAAQRFHAQPLDAKLAVRINGHNLGYMPMRGSLNRTSAYNPNGKPSLNEAFFLRRQRTPDDPDVIADKPLRGLNQWPAGLPGFRRGSAGLHGPHDAARPEPGAGPFRACLRAAPTSSSASPITRRWKASRRTSSASLRTPTAAS